MSAPRITIGVEEEFRLVDVAREAFFDGMQLTAGIAAVIAAGLAVLAITALRHVSPANHDQPGATAEEQPSEDDIDFEQAA